MQGARKARAQASWSPAKGDRVDVRLPLEPHGKDWAAVPLAAAWTVATVVKARAGDGKKAYVNLLVRALLWN